MSRVLGTATLGSTGLVTLNLGLPSTPTWVHITVCEKSSADSAAHFSSGKATATTQFCQSVFTDSLARHSFNSNSRIIQHYERVSGSVAKVLSASFDSFTANGIKLDVDVANANYQVLIEAGD